MTFEKLKSGNYSAICENENGEPVCIYHHPATEETEEYFRTETYQNNGWIRDNYYYEDGTVEELFRKE